MPLFPEFQRRYTDDAPSGRRIWLPSRRGELIVWTGATDGGSDRIRLLGEADGVRDAMAGVVPLSLGSLDGASYLTVEAPADWVLPNGWKSINLRNLYGAVADAEWAIAGYAAHLLHWERTSRFCPACGAACAPLGHEWVRTCTACSEMRYPSISPAVLVLIHDGADRVLLAHKPGWGDMYSIIAGFVLPGESLEECVNREVAEEVGVSVTGLRYQGSQPWPFPQQLMIGFTAQWQSGETCIDREELDGAEWFDAQSLPPLPQPLSLSRRIIDSWRSSRLDTR